MVPCILAHRAYPYHPCYYADSSSKFVQSYETDIGWMMLDIVRTIGDGVQGDACDLLLSQYEGMLLELYSCYY